MAVRLQTWGENALPTGSKPAHGDVVRAVVSRSLTPRPRLTGAAVLSAKEKPLVESGLWSTLRNRLVLTPLLCLPPRVCPAVDPHVRQTCMAHLLSDGLVVSP
jgi:hypothetical protein